MKWFKKLFKKEKKFETCVACSAKLEEDRWNFPFVYDVCRRCTADAIRWAAVQQLKENILKYKRKDGD